MQLTDISQQHLIFRPNIPNIWNIYKHTPFSLCPDFFLLLSLLYLVLTRGEIVFADLASIVVLLLVEFGVVGSLELGGGLGD